MKTSEDITEAKKRRIERNQKIREIYKIRVADGGMKSQVISDIAKSYKITIPTVYSILNTKTNEK